MDQNLKTKWIEALRSGEYRQANGQLQVGGSFCCLGVLCKIAGIRIASSGNQCLDESGKEDHYQPLKKILDAKYHTPLYRMNDTQGKSFSEIADYIEQTF